MNGCRPHPGAPSLWRGLGMAAATLCRMILPARYSTTQLIIALADFCNAVHAYQIMLHHPCLQISACLAFVVSIYTCKQLWHEFTYQWGINRWHWWCLGSRVAACTSAHMPTSSGVVQLFAVNTVLSGAQQCSTYSIPEGSKYKRQSDRWGGVQRCPGCQCVGGGCLGGAGGRRGAVRLRRAGVRAAAEDLGHQRATCLCPGALAGAYLPTQVTRHRAGDSAEGR